MGNVVPMDLNYPQIVGTFPVHHVQLISQKSGEPPPNPLIGSVSLFRIEDIRRARVSRLQ